MIRRCFQYSNSTYLQRPSGHTCTCNFLTSQYCAFDKSSRFVRTNITRVNRSGYPDDLSGEKKLLKQFPTPRFPLLTHDRTNRDRFPRLRRTVRHVSFRPFLLSGPTAVGSSARASEKKNDSPTLGYSDRNEFGSSFA